MPKQRVENFVIPGGSRVPRFPRKFAVEGMPDVRDCLDRKVRHYKPSRENGKSGFSVDMALEKWSPTGRKHDLQTRGRYSIKVSTYDSVARLDEQPWGHLMDGI